MPSGDESAYVAFMDRISHADLTLEELNQPEPWTGINAYRSDPLLVDISSGMPRACDVSGTQRSGARIDVPV